MNTKKTDTLILIKAMLRLADDIQSDDGVANAAISEAADRLTELERENAALRDAIEESEEFARKNGEACGSKIRELLAENAALRENFMAAESEIILLREEREELRAMLEQKGKHP